ncbi:MAG: hypothetical protein SNJ71_05345 [Bacteroidales bacterium]
MTEINTLPIEENHTPSSYSQYVIDMLNKALPTSMEDDPIAALKLCEVVTNWINFLNSYDDFIEYLTSCCKKSPTS